MSSADSAPKKTGSQTQSEANLEASNSEANPAAPPKNPSKRIHDPFVALIAALTRHFGKPRSEGSLMSGMPLVKGRIPETSLKRVSRRANLSCHLTEGGFEQFDELTLPAFLILEGNTACVLLKKLPDNDEGKTVWRIISPVTRGVADVTQVELEKRYEGRAYIMQPDALTEAPSALTSTLEGHWLWEAFKPNFWIYGQAALGTITVNMLALCLPLFIMIVYDRIVPNYAIESLTVLTIGMVIVAASEFGLKTLRAYMTDVAGRRMDVILGNRVFDKVLQVKMTARTGPSGVTANTIRELDVLKEFLNSSTLAILGDLPFLLLFIGVMAWVSGILAVVPLVAIPITLAVCFFTQYPLHHIMEKAFKNASQRNAVLFDVLNGMETIKSSGAESWAADLWERAHAASVKSGFAGRSFNLFSSHFLMFSQAISTLVIVVMGVVGIHEGDLSFGALFAAVMLNGRAMAPLNQVAGTIGKMHGVVIAYRAIDGLMRSPVERDENIRHVHISDLRGHIAFSNVDFSYPVIHTQGQNDAPVVKALEGCNFNIEPGEHVAIIGAIGSGKSTVLKLLLNLYQPQQGSVRLDELDIAQIDPTDLRDRIGYVPQNPHFFQGTIRDNITFHQVNATEEAVIAASAKAGVLNWIKNCPMGFAQPVGERGEALSGGQRQSLALARALLKEPKVLVLDEPTSLLDNRSEMMFVQQLLNMPKDKTLVVVTHRPALLSAVDRIIVMDGGKAVLDGDKDAVLKQLQAKPQGGEKSS